ncbi:MULTISPECIES: DUF2125 domain-containing protein [Asaia]|uniref:DUF2125 domain-containing protein n=1 Tax=Asaia bogorensis TaxID=91915 RepID=A0A060QL13_9PROT|nr:MULTISPECIES: DUF2125 domain-containing protein [Asaia]ETC99119.1 hypothetical protein P792_05675 [Asaia sp. SF2.1]CDG39927.1 hypothetical protein ASAP_1882 [Asaia bogorensis]
MRKGLFFTIIGVTSLLLSIQVLDAYRISQIDRQIVKLSATARAEGWRFTWQEEARQWRPWGSRIVLTAPLIGRASGEGWTGRSLTITPGWRHPLAASFTNEGAQILRPGGDVVLSAGGGSGWFDPSRQVIIYRTAGVTASGLPISGIDTLTLRDITARFLPGGRSADPSLAWSLDLRADRVEPKLSATRGSGSLTPSLPDLLAALPEARYFHLVLAALHRTSDGHDLSDHPAGLTHDVGYERFLIQEASFTLGPLSVVARGTLSGTGQGTVWAHLSGLQGFARYWVAHTPQALRNNPDYARLLAGLDEQTARIPDHLDLPIPLGPDDILLQNHISAIITGHYR